LRSTRSAFKPSRCRNEVAQVGPEVRPASEVTCAGRRTLPAAERDSLPRFGISTGRAFLLKLASVIAFFDVLYCSRADLPRPDPGLARLAVANFWSFYDPFAAVRTYSGYGAPAMGYSWTISRSAYARDPELVSGSAPMDSRICRPGTPNQILDSRACVLQQRFCQAHNCGGKNSISLHANTGMCGAWLRVSRACVRLWLPTAERRPYY